MEFNYSSSVKNSLNVLAKIHSEEREALEKIKLEAEWTLEILNLIMGAETLLDKIKSGKGGRKEAKQVHEILLRVLSYLSDEHKMDGDLNSITKRVVEGVNKVSLEIEKAFRYLK